MLPHTCSTPVFADTKRSEAYAGLAEELGAEADVDVIDADLLAALGRDGGGLDTAVYQFGAIKPQTLVQRLLKQYNFDIMLGPRSQISTAPPPHPRTRRVRCPTSYPGRSGR